MGFSYSSEIHDDYQGREHTKAFNTIKHLFSLPSSSAGSGNSTDPILYWTSDKGLVIETHEADGYYLATYGQSFDLEHPVVFHRSQQPIPIPLNAPKDVQCIPFKYGKAEVTWTPVGNTGSKCNSFQAWNYRVKLSNDQGRVIKEDTATSLSLMLDLKMVSSLYTVAVQAYTENGASPWSDQLTVKSLPENANPKVIWAARSYLHESDILLSDVRSTSVKENTLAIEANEDILTYTNGSALFLRNLTEDSDFRAMVTGMAGISSIALEPFAKMIYFTIPGRQNILRISYSQQSTGPEMIPVTAIARNLCVNSLQAKMCWTSLRNKVQCSWLNGTGLETVYKVSQWSDKFITGLTIDTVTTNKMYLSQKSYLTFSILSKSLNEPTSGSWEEVVQYDDGSIFSGPLKLFFGKITWLSQENLLMIFDIQGKSLASKKLTEPGEDKIVAYTVSQTPSQKFPESVGALAVIPDPVDPGSIQFHEGVINWDSVTNVNFGSVSYDILVSPGSGAKPFLQTTQTNSFSFNDIQSAPYLPNSEFSVKIVSQTDWAKASGVPISKTFRTPQLPPLEPKNLRAFYGPVNMNKNISMTLRWEEPEASNGPIDIYRISLKSYDGFSKTFETTGLEKNHIILEPILPGQEKVLEVSVWGVNGAGTGVPANLNLTLTEVARPIPRIVTVQGDSIHLIDTDFQVVQSALRSSGGLKITDLDPLTSEQSVIYANEEGKIFSHNFETKIVRELFQYSGESDTVGNSGAKIRSLAVDWIGRYIYFAHGRAGAQTQVSRLALDEPLPRSYPVLNVTGEVLRLRVEPFSSTLYFTQLTEDLKKYRIRRATLGLGGLALPDQDFSGGVECQPCLWDLKSPEFQLSYRQGGKKHKNCLVAAYYCVSLICPVS